MTSTWSHPPEIPSVELEAVEQFAADIARRTGAALLEQFGRQIAVEFKGQDERSPVTEADRAAEQALRDAIRERFPGHRILGEEGDDHEPQPGGFLWVLDPLDGTTNFINGLPLFCVSVGVLHGRAPVAGAIFTAVSHRGGPGVYHARRGGGAWFEAEPLRMRLDDEPRRSRLSGQPGFFGRRPGAVSQELRQKQGEVRVLGSVALELAYAAAGVLQYALFFGPKIWDVAAGVLIVQEAGGVVLSRGRRDDGLWNDLRSFEPAPPRKPEDPAGELAGLRRWGRAMVAGSPRVAAFVAAGLRGGPPPETAAGKAVAWALHAAAGLLRR